MRPVRPRTLCLLCVGALLLLRGGSCVQIARPYGAPTAKQVLAGIQARAQRLRSLRAEARMSHRTEQGKIKATVRMMLARGGKLRFDVVSPFDTPLSTLVANGHQFVLVDAKANRHYYGPATPCNIARLLRVELEPDAVLAVLAGATPLIEHRRLSIAWDGRAGEEILTLEGEGRRQTIRLDGRLVDGKPSWELVHSEVRDTKGALLLEVRASDYQRVGGLRLPARLSIRQPKANAEVTFRKREVNLTLPAAAFSLPDAGGLPSERVECHDNPPS